MKRFICSASIFGVLLLFFTVAVCSSTPLAADDITTAAVFAEVLPDLASADLEKIESSQQRLQQLCFEVGAPGKETEKKELNNLMAAQLDQPIDPVAKTWILYQLSRTGSNAEVDAIASQLADPDFRVRQQALRTLVTIKTEKALNAVQKAAITADDEFKKEIELTLRVATYDLTIPIETEWPLCLPHVDDSEVEAWLANYDSFDVTTKVRTIASLAVRNDRKYRSYAVRAAMSDDPDLRADGILALEKLGAVEDIPLLFQSAKDPVVGRLAIIVASRIEYPGFDEAILEGLKNSNNPEDFLNYTKVAVTRHNAAALPLIFAGAATFEMIRTELLLWAESLTTKEDFPEYISLVLRVKSAKDREELQRSVTRIVAGDATVVIPLVTEKNREFLLPLIGRIGGKNAFDYLVNLYASKNPLERELAVRGLANLPNAEHAETLLEIVRNSQISEAGRIAAFRGYVRVMSLPQGEIGIKISDHEKFTALKSAFESAERDDERTLVLDRMKAIRVPETLVFVLPYIDDPKFTETATTSVLELAHHDFLRKADPQAFTDALNKIINRRANPLWVDEAKRYLTAIQESE